MHREQRIIVVRAATFRQASLPQARIAASPSLTDGASNVGGGGGVFAGSTPTRDSAFASDP